MSTAPQPSSAAQKPQSYFEQQRELLILEIAQSLNAALHNLNQLNRSLEEVVQVGNEFAPVESLWSHFESVMGQQAQGQEKEREDGGERERERERGEEE